MSIGRNDPCVCGSGKKYKKCCLLNEIPDQQELFRMRLSRMRDDLIMMILKHTNKVYGPFAIEEAWQEFYLWRNEEAFDPESRELQLFMPFFFYDWSPDEAETQVNEDAPKNESPAQTFLRARKRGLDELAKDYLEECCKTGFSFFEILECWPGKGFKVKDVLTEEVHSVVERLGSQNIKPADLLFGKAVTLNSLCTLEACSTIVLPPQYKLEVMELRNDLRKNGPITQAVLKDYILEIIELYQDIRDRLENPKMPILHNTDGEVIAPHFLTFEIEDSDMVITALAPMSLVHSREEILSWAKRGADGEIESVEFPWLKRGNKKQKTWENTVLGRIKIQKKKMLVEANSVKRADRFVKELTERMPDGWKLLSKVIEPVEQHLQKNRPTGAPDSSDEAAKSLEQSPEGQKLMKQLMQKHWEGWVHEQIPALGDKTPFEAAKSNEGREMLEAVISQFERNCEEKSIPGQDKGTFAELRDRLGL